MSWVYFIQHGGAAGAVKIGTTTGNPHARLRALQTGAPEPLRLLAAIEGGPTEERGLHARFASSRLRADGEWFQASPELLAFIAGASWGKPQPEDDEPVDESMVPREQFAWLTSGHIHVIADVARGIALRSRFFETMAALQRRDGAPIPDWLRAQAEAVINHLDGWLHYAGDPLESHGFWYSLTPQDAREWLEALTAALERPDDEGVLLQ